MGGVIFQIVACYPVHQDVHSCAVFLEPGDQIIELSGIERELTTPPRMRADELLVHSTPGDAKQLRSILAELSRLPG